jgi:hypothetical protein
VLLGAFLLGALSVAAKEQARVALQARLDVCAVRIAAARERLFSRLVTTNRALEGTVLGLYAARGALLLGPGGAALGGLSEAALLRANGALAAAESALVAAAQAGELAAARCAPTTVSRETALCAALPPLAELLAREPTLFPDVRGRLRGRAEADGLGRIRCFGERGLVTVLAVQGDQGLLQEGFHDGYER